MKVCLRIACMCVLLVIAAGAFHSVSAREFRGVKVIPTPGALPEDAKAVAEIQPVDRKIVEDVVNKLMYGWNRDNMRKYLSNEFFDKSRLVDAIDIKVPRNARLRILSIQGIQTMAQHIQPDASGEEWIVSIVSATVKTQLEFNDAVNGFQRREGTNEYIFRVRQKIKAE